MPIYVYECDACQGRFEYMQTMSEPPKTLCETCGGKLGKIIVPIAFHLKGGGWYKDLYSSSKGAKGGGGGGESKSDGKSESKSDGKSESKSDGKSEGKSENKSETKSESKPSGGGTGGTGSSST